MFIDGSIQDTMFHVQSDEIVLFTLTSEDEEPNDAEHEPDHQLPQVSLILTI